MDLEEERIRLGLRLKAARVSAKVTQEEAAEAAGVQRPAISMWEHGRSMPSLLQFKALATLYGALTHRLLFGRSPVTLTETEARELALESQKFTPRLKAKMEVLFLLLTDPRTEETQV